MIDQKGLRTETYSFPFDKKNFDNLRHDVSRTSNNFSLNWTHVDRYVQATKHIDSSARLDYWARAFEEYYSSLTVT